MNRAVSQKAKEEKANLILQVAKRMFDNSTFEQIKMSELAYEAGVSKGTLFNYFATKEVLFYELYLNENLVFNTMLYDALNKFESFSFEQFKNMLIKITGKFIDKNIIALRLLAIKNNILEQNLPTEYVREVKLELNTQLNQMADYAIKKVNVLNQKDYIIIINTLNNLLMGFVSSWLLPTKTKDIINVNKLNALKVNVKEDTLNALNCYLEGYKRINL